MQKTKKYTGHFTALSHDNFQIIGISSPPVFQKALGIVKLAAAQTNHNLKFLSKKEFEAIKKACEEFINLKYTDQFILDVFQAGAGTSYNMNANEIIANRANEILKSEPAPKGPIHPNNHVNMAQSTNDVMPTTTRIATLLLTPNLLEEINKLEKAIAKIANKYKNLLKIGRTHLMDAVPITLGQELDSYVQALQKSRKFIEEEAKKLHILGIGGTALGTGINTHPKYQPLVVKNLSTLTKIPFRSGKNLTEMTNNMNSFLNFSSTLRSLAVNLLNLSSNLKLMNMGPKGGVAEIILPEVQPGSSIMPGKINPSIPECLEMICLQVLGNDKTIEMASMRSQFDLNIFCPIIMYNLLQSMQILTSGLFTLRTKAMEGLKVNEKQIKEMYENSLVTATALAPYIGYDATAKVVKTALSNGTTIREEVLKAKLLKEKDLKEILSSKRTTKPSLRYSP